MYRRRNSELEVFLVHPSGPFWAKKDLGAWSILKGEFVDGEEPLAVAKREFEEETNFAPRGNFIKLGDLKHPGGKVITACLSRSTFAENPAGSEAGFRRLAAKMHTSGL